MKKLVIALVVFTAAPVMAQRLIESPPETQPLVVTIRPVGPDQDAVEDGRKMVSSHPSVIERLGETRHRMLWFDLLEPTVVSSPFRAMFYDYTNNRAVIAEGRLGQPDSVMVRFSSEQPHPSDEEFDAAIAILRADEHFGPLLENNSLAPYPPMPPVIETDAVNAVNERTVTVGLMGLEAKAGNEIVGVNLIRNSVVRYEGGAPPRATANAGVCGIPGAGQGTTPRGTAGQYTITVTQGQTLLWAMTAIRPSVSSGLRGSGIEIQNVAYLGKSVLKRAHVPILNVQYENNGCGPYRDWQWQEGYFQADGTEVAPGVKESTLAQTVLDNGTDVGNHRGFAYYTVGTEMRLVTELEAGWYRYIHEWRFDANGTIRPRFRFGAVTNSCVCITHTHHAYFRLDFDIATAQKNLIWEVNGRDFMTRQTVEKMSLRNPGGNRRWIVENSATGDRYLIQPNASDGFADTYGRGDLWLLRYRASELDDGRNTTGGQTEVDLGKFVNGESIEYQDVVVWYGGHSVHSSGGEHADDVGPDIIPVVW